MTLKVIQVGGARVEYLDVAPAVPKSWDAFDFLRRFQPSERVAIRGSLNPLVADFRAILDALVANGGRVFADDPDTQAGLSLLVAAGLITEARKAEILA